jgi:hypothetical protein
VLPISFGRANLRQPPYGTPRGPVAAPNHFGQIRRGLDILVLPATSGVFDPSSFASGLGGRVIRPEASLFRLIVRQGKALGLTPEEVLNVAPLPSTMATLYAWGWMTREKSWLEGLVSLSVTEWANDDRLLGDIGGGLSSRMAKRWMDDLGFGWEQMPNFKVHAQADEEHSDMFLGDLEKFATGEKEGLVIQSAKESMELLKIFRFGIAKEMDRLNERTAPM